MRKVTSEQRPRSSGGGHQEPIREKRVPCRQNCASHVPREPCALRAHPEHGVWGVGGVGRTGGKGRGRGGQGGSSMPGGIYAAVGKGTHWSAGGGKPWGVRSISRDRLGRCAYGEEARSPAGSHLHPSPPELHSGWVFAPCYRTRSRHASLFFYCL